MIGTRLPAGTRGAGGAASPGGASDVRGFRDRERLAFRGGRLLRWHRLRCGVLGRRPRAPLPRLTWLVLLACLTTRLTWLAWSAGLILLVRQFRPPRIRPIRRPPPRRRLRRTGRRLRGNRLTIISFPPRLPPHIKIVVVGERFRLITGGFYRIMAMVLSGIVVKLRIIGHLGALSTSVKIQQIAAETGDNNGGKYKKHAFKSKANMTKLSQPPRLSWDSFSVICLAKPAGTCG